MSALMPLLMLIASFLQNPMATPPPEPPIEIAPNTFLIRPTPMPGRGPDGNTVIIDAPNGLIVVDTGRHTSQSDAIIASARRLATTPSAAGRSQLTPTITSAIYDPTAARRRIALRSKPYQRGGTTMIGRFLLRN